MFYFERVKKPGNTPLIEHPISNSCGFDRIEIKDESANPTGTFKDRRSAYIVEQATRQKIHSLVLISAGNAAYSLARYAREADIAVTAVVDERLSGNIKNVLNTVCARVIETNLSEKFLNAHTLKHMARTKKQERIWDVTNGFQTAFKAIVEELPEEPTSIVVPKGSGEAMNGIFDATQERGWRTNVIGIGSFYDERLRTTFNTNPTARKGSNGADMMTCYAENLMDEEVAAQCVPSLKAERASKIAMGAIFIIHPSVFGKHTILINSGEGKLRRRPTARQSS